MATEINEHVAEALTEYFDMPVNFGDDSHALKMAEADAFVAGWDACLSYILGVVDKSGLNPMYKFAAERIAPNFKATREV